jgi:prepilin-type N-terminal cleavage/methylation domain-containing protein
MNRKRKGFTVAELLIVVAIVAVLVSVAIPVFIKKTEKAREAYDIYTMRQAASAAVHLYYSGVSDSASAQAAGMKWWPNGNAERSNAAGAYNPATGGFVQTKQDLPNEYKTYGKGTSINGGTNFFMGNTRGAYKADADYTKAVVMVAIYPQATPKHLDVYWKNSVGDDKYVGDQDGVNVPKYCIRIMLN